MSGQGDFSCPFTEQIPQDAVYFGKMPRRLRGAFLKAYELRADNRRAEALVFEEAISDLLQEHFKHEMDRRRLDGEPSVEQFRLGGDWNVYALPVTRSL
jgi:hypothetical protein